ncbi:MAG TPA: DUF3048 domain-containing protein [Candidatus Saccharimonadia bacterium]|nr:DUF3048 domain-containing protein [Candidatus Saccharimonadia bacterium]
MKDISKPIKRSIPKKADLNFTIDEDDNLSETTDESATTDLNTKLKPIKNRNFKLTKKQLIVGLIILAVVVIGLIYFFVFREHGQNSVTSIKNTSTSKKTTTASPISPLTGMPVTLAKTKLPVTGIMIENSDEARPQSGLSQAGVVFEALAEGGITRFLALFQEGQPSSIGPIRSARPYFIDWALGFDAAYVHVGGSPDALSQIKTDNVKDINQFYYGNYFTRITSREAPHNVYTSISSLHGLETTLDYDKSNFTGFPRKKDQPDKTPNATNIAFNIASPDYKVNYTYDKPLNSYKRSEGGSPMIDANTNKQLEPKVVIAIVVPLSQGALDASGAYYSDYSDIGSGSAYIFQDGTLTKSIWTKDSPTSQITFTDIAGNAIKLNAGQTWITALSSSNLVAYQ